MNAALVAVSKQKVKIKGGDTMSKSRVKELGGRKFDVVEEGLDEEQVAAFIDELIQQRDTLLNQVNSLLSYIRFSKNMAGKENEPIGSSEQEAGNKAAGTVTGVSQNRQPVVEPAELEEESRSALPEAIKAIEGAEEPDLYHGELELAILPPVDPAKLLQFERRLRDSFELSILSMHGSPSKGGLITVRLSQPQPLLQSLNQIPGVKEAAEEIDTPIQVNGNLPSLFKNKHKRRIWVTLDMQAN